MFTRAQAAVLATAAASLTALAACAHQAPVASLAAADRSPSQVLVFSDDGANAKLALADQPAALMLECAHGSRSVHVTHASAASPVPVLTLASGPAASTLPASRQAFEGQTLVLGEASIDAPALAAFRRTGVLQVAYGGEGLTAAAKPAPFFAACEGRAS